MPELWVAGYPSFLGGADSELDHQIDLWRRHDVDVHLVPMFGEDARMRKFCDERGCHTHRYHPGIFKDKIVVSFCNGEFLSALPLIQEAGKPRCVIWFNCMTWTFPKEIEAHKQGWITLHAFQTNYQRKWLLPALSKVGKVNEFDYSPYFNPQNASQSIQFKYRKPDRWFALGRISRDDMAKYSQDMWRIFDRVLCPMHKKVFVLGFGDKGHKKCGSPPAGLDYQLWRENAVPVRQVYSLLHCMIHKTGGSRENLPRILFEAWGYGVPLVCENDYGFVDYIENGVTGYLCNSSEEMSFRASELAFNEELRKKIIHSAYDVLTNEFVSDGACWASWEKMFDEYGRDEGRVFVSSDDAIAV
jgi:glycosyltransferase involved in cell wall biosynthesis